MPQFDFFIWFSLSLGTILTFQTLYYIFLYYIIAPFSNFQKTLIKLYNLKRLRKLQIQLDSFFDYNTTLYIKKNYLKENCLEEVSSIKTLEKKIENKRSIKKNFVIFKFKNKKIVATKFLKKKDLFFSKLLKKLGKNLKFKKFYIIIIKKKNLKKKLRLKLKKKKLKKKNLKKKPKKKKRGKLKKTENLLARLEGYKKI